ncbi:ATP-grasp domain-containing protein [Bacillus cereus]
MNNLLIRKRLIMIGGRTHIYRKVKQFNLHLTLIQEKEFMVQEDYELADQVIHAPVDAPYLVDLVAVLHKESPFDAVISFLEAGLLNAAIIQHKLGISGNKLLPVEVTRYKDKMREQMMLKKIPSIPFSVVTNVEDVESFAEKVGYPIILKSTIGSGSRQVHKLEHSDEIHSALNSIRQQFPNANIIAERFLVGKEISVECFSWDGKHSVVAIIDKLTTGAPFFVEIGHSTPSTLPSHILEKVKRLTIDFLNAIEQTHGPTHTEIMIYEDEPYIIESHTRGGGGLIFEIVENVYGINFYAEAFKRIAGVKPEQNETPKVRANASAIRHFVFPEGKVIRIEGMEEAKNVPGITRCELMLKVGQNVKNITNGRERYGHIVVMGDSIEKLKNSLEEAQGKINVTII